MSQEWAGRELAGINLGDGRLNKRSVALLDRLADKPTASIPHACNGWAETQAACRFLAQQEIGWEDILAPHFNCTQQRMQGQPVVLCIQDTAELDFNGQQTEGLGTFELCCQRGIVYASHLCRQRRAGTARRAGRLDVGTGCIQNGQS